MRHTIVKVGEFPDAQQRVIDAEFDCISPESALADAALAAKVSGIVTRSNYTVTQELIDHLPALKAICTSGVGFDGIPQAYVRERGIVVTNTPGLLDAAVCELAVGLLLALMREIPRMDRHVRDGRWQREGAYRLTTGLAGKRIGIVGLGRIGRGIAERLAPFGVTIAYAARSARAGLPWRHFSCTKELAEASDCLIVCCPGGAATHHLIDAEVLHALGEDGFLVNVARGSVIDEAALCEALAAGRLRGAALDVFAQEPLADSPLKDLPNVILTPHAGSATHETRAAMVRLTLDNLHAVLGGGAALTPV